MNMLRLARNEIRLLFREKITAFWVFIFPVIMIWLIGSIFEKFSSSTGLNYIQYYAPAWIAVNITTISIFTIGVTINTYREMGILRRYQATPLGVSSILGANFLCGSTIFFLSFITIVIEGVLLYDLKAPMYPLSTLLAIVLSMMAMFAFGMFITSLTKNARQSAAIGSISLNIMLLLSGATMPVDVMPDWLLAFSKALPLYYVIDILQNTWSKCPILDLKVDLLAISVMIVAFGSLAIKTFKWTSNDN